ncbi:MAG: HRDC domain-containing protein [Microthrixaceae bacterium]|nr:HRDC domain-containing protein [Microthrixaceae bacterium]
MNRKPGRDAPASADPPDWDLIHTQREFEDLLEEWSGVERYALDTEFHRERTYHPRVALVQVAWPGRLALIDPLEVDLTPLADVLAGDGCAVMHAARQDLEILNRECGLVPKVLFDTQVAANFVGFSNPSLGTLSERLTGTKVPKGDRLTDWLRRPLKPTQLSYAAADVRNLLDIADRLIEDLDRRGRSSWAADAIEDERSDAWTTRDPAVAWTRIKEVRHLKGQALASAQALARWREETASIEDVPTRNLLSDLGLVGLAQTRPDTVKAARAVRGVDGRNLRGPRAEEALAVIAESIGQPPEDAASVRSPEVPGELRSAIGLVTTWVKQLARDLDLDPSTVATRADVEQLLAPGPDGRLGGGWRAELVGDPIRDLVAGRAALAFDRGTGLVLEPRREAV